MIAPELLTATGWQAVDETGRYWRHPLRYPEATFDRFEVDAIENRRHRVPKPVKAPACRCRLAYGRLEEGICWKCGRRVGGSRSRTRPAP